MVPGPDVFFVTVILFLLLSSVKDLRHLIGILINL